MLASSPVIFHCFQGADVSDEDDFKGSKDDPHRLLNINLDEWVIYYLLSLIHPQG